ncbi:MULTISPECIES: hypothetical protein, partial [unclassified Mesorhizobium]|uniref:hypothetical protein n=1 Tax=unclassified Mesorhizobium TaxID=325217 RepID=UPI0030141E13
APLPAGKLQRKTPILNGPVFRDQITVSNATHWILQSGEWRDYLRSLRRVSKARAAGAITGGLLRVAIYVGLFFGFGRLVPLM